ncbi:unnamed protein product [Pylaiella littoralis]
MFKFGFYPPAEATEEQQQHQQRPPSPPTAADAAATDDARLDAAATADQNAASRVIEGAARTAIPSGVTAPPAQALAWQSGGLTLVRAVPSANACPEAPQESDLVPGVYEGGLKVWEASLDLVDHLVSSGGDGNGGVFAEDEATVVTGRRKRVLELGCGHGFPGIVALQQGLRVCFSDFNREVIEQVTIPNVKLNVEERYWPLAEYYSGDWNSLSPLLEERDGGELFDLILTAETLYTTVVADKVLGMVLKHLSPGGQALVASKRFYFGTGGSTQYFRDKAAATGRLVCLDTGVIDTGKGNIREILRVSWRDEEAAARAGAVAIAGDGRKASR